MGEEAGHNNEKVGSLSPNHLSHAEGSTVLGRANPGVYYNGLCQARGSGAETIQWHLLDYLIEGKYETQ